MDKSVRRNIVISAVNLRKGGTLTVLRDCLQYLSGREDLHVTALVHKKELSDYPNIDYIEIPWSIKSWLRRLWCEYVTMHRISRRLPATDLWLSLHDTSPRVKAVRQAVYCHTPFPFMERDRKDWKKDYKISLFSRLTKYAYRINVHSNDYLIVQQSWMRRAMAEMLRFDIGRIIVSPPAFRPLPIPEIAAGDEPPVTTFIYPATADVHKDFETLCEAARILEERKGKDRFKVILTISGDENKYAEYLKLRWDDVSSLDFHGLMRRDELAQAFAMSSCLVFPSRAETWGLPVSEYLPTGKPMILSDLPYAHETAAGASVVRFFPVRNPAALADCMEELTDKRMDYFAKVEKPAYEQPYAPSWESLFEMLLK